MFRYNASRGSRCTICSDRRKGVIREINWNYHNYFSQQLQHWYSHESGPRLWYSNVMNFRRRDGLHFRRIVLPSFGSLAEINTGFPICVVDPLPSQTGSSATASSSSSIRWSYLLEKISTRQSFINQTSINLSTEHRSIDALKNRTFFGA